MSKQYRQLVAALMAMVVGMGLLWFGFFGIVDMKPDSGLSDEQVLDRARELGWAPIKEILETQTTTGAQTSPND